MWDGSGSCAIIVVKPFDRREMNNFNVIGPTDSLERIAASSVWTRLLIFKFHFNIENSPLLCFKLHKNLAEFPRFCQASLFSYLRPCEASFLCVKHTHTHTNNSPSDCAQWKRIQCQHQRQLYMQRSRRISPCISFFGRELFSFEMHCLITDASLRPL